MRPAVGRVYVLSNKAMPGLLKIGYTMNTVEGRVKELSSATGVPSEFCIEYQVECRDAAGLEALVHESLQNSRHNNSREFFLISLADAVDEIRKHAKEVLDEEFSENYAPKVSLTRTLEDFRSERNTITNWIEVHSSYWKIFISKSHLEQCEDGLIFWQLVSFKSNKRMKEYQSIISKNRYYVENGVYEPIYECCYLLPMCTGEIVDESLIAKKKFFPIPETTPAHAILSVVKNWI
jgi:hypothetical protein